MAPLTVTQFVRKPINGYAAKNRNYEERVIRAYDFMRLALSARATFGAQLHEKAIELNCHHHFVPKEKAPHIAQVIFDTAVIELHQLRPLLLIMRGEPFSNILLELIRWGSLTPTNLRYFTNYLRDDPSLNFKPYIDQAQIITRIGTRLSAETAKKIFPHVKESSHERLICRIAAFQMIYEEADKFRNIDASSAMPALRIGEPERLAQITAFQNVGFSLLRTELAYRPRYVLDGSVHYRKELS